MHVAHEECIAPYGAPDDRDGRVYPAGFERPLRGEHDTFEQSKRGPDFLTNTITERVDAGRLAGVGERRHTNAPPNDPQAWRRAAEGREERAGARIPRVWSLFERPRQDASNGRR